MTEIVPSYLRYRRESKCEVSETGQATVATAERLFAAAVSPHVQVWRDRDGQERAVCVHDDWESDTEGHELSAAWAEHLATVALPVVGPLIAQAAREGARKAMMDGLIAAAEDKSTPGMLTPCPGPLEAAENYRLTCPHCGHTIGLGDDGVCTNESCT